jgi:TRAP-type C4-dicarboxylate transport system permease small subunit
VSRLSSSSRHGGVPRRVRDRGRPGALTRANAFALRTCDGLAGLVVVLLMIGVSASVGLRLFGIAVTGVIELGGLSLLFLTFLAAPHVAARDDNVKVEVIDSVLSSRSRRFVDVLASLVQIGVMGVLVWASAQLVLVDIQRGTTTGGDLRLSRWMVGLVVPIASALVLVQQVRRLVHVLKGGGDGASSGDPVPYDGDREFL